MELWFRHHMHACHLTAKGMRFSSTVVFTLFRSTYLSFLFHTAENNMCCLIFASHLSHTCLLFWCLGRERNGFRLYSYETAEAFPPPSPACVALYSACYQASRQRAAQRGGYSVVCMWAVGKGITCMCIMCMGIAFMWKGSGHVGWAWA